MKELLIDMLPLLMLLCFLSAMIIFCFVDYHLYKYLREKNVVLGYWDYMGYVWGQQGQKKYKIIWDKTVNHHLHLRKAKVFILLYWGLMSAVVLLLVLTLWMSR